jgi:hypothetical protein
MQNNDIIFSGVSQSYYPPNQDYDILIARTDSNLYAPPIGISNQQNFYPMEYSLYQNYPNPFNPITKIRFDIPAVGQRLAFDKRLIIYDILGRVVTTLVNTRLSPGSYEVEFDSSKYASGLYFYSLEAGNHKETKKMVLIK